MSTDRMHNEWKRNTFAGSFRPPDRSKNNKRNRGDL